MELIYRGVRYQNKKLEFHNLVKNNKLPIFYCKKELRRQSNHSFPLTQYCQQLFSRRKSAIISPAKFMYQYQIKLLENCWQIDMIILLNFCWQATIIMEMERSLRRDSHTQLKYRGATYYKPNMN